MNSLFLRVATRFLVPLICFLSLFLLFRGHNDPGGGFIAGLMLSLGMIFYALAHSPRQARTLILLDPIHYLGVGWLLSLVSALFPLMVGESFMEGVWGPEIYFPFVGMTKLGTVFLFDVGVYFLVFGTTLNIVFSLLEMESA